MNDAVIVEGLEKAKLEPGSAGAEADVSHEDCEIQVDTNASSCPLPSPPPFIQQPASDTIITAFFGKSGKG